MITFRKLDKNAALDERSSSLTDWYRDVRDTPISEFSAGDLCRACRQELFLDYVLPMALQQIQCDPFSGDLFDGELVSVVSRINIPFWETHPLLFSEAKKVLQDSLKNLDKDVTAEVNRFCQLSISK